MGKTWMLAIIAIIAVAFIFTSSSKPTEGVDIVPYKFVDTPYVADAGTPYTAQVQLWNKGDTAGRTNLEVGIYAVSALNTFNPSLLQSAVAFKTIDSCKSVETFVGAVKLTEDLQPGDKKTVTVTLSVPSSNSKISNSVSNWEGTRGEYVLVAGTYDQCGTAHNGAIFKDFTIN